MNQNLLELKTREQELYMPTADELREFQDYNIKTMVEYLESESEE